MQSQSTVFCTAFDQQFSGRYPGNVDNILVICDTATIGWNLTIPDVRTWYGKTFLIKNKPSSGSGNDIVLTPTAGQTINGASSYTLNATESLIIRNDNVSDSIIVGDFSTVSSSITHNLLSATHTDASAASVVRGDIVYGNSTPAWARLAKGSNGYLLGCDANDIKWDSKANWNICAADDSRLSDSRTPLAHVLDGALHTVSGKTAGHFLKALTADTFGFAAHGLTYSDVGAAASGHNHDSTYLGIAAKAADSDKLDGNDISYFAVAGAAPAAHQLDGALHTVSGLTTGHFLKATGATTFGFAAHGLTYSDVGALPSSAISGTQNYIAKFGAGGATVGNSQISDDGANVIINTGACALQNSQYFCGKNAAGANYRKLIGLDSSNIVNVGIDTDIAAVTFGATSELMRLDATGLGIGRAATIAGIDVYKPSGRILVESSTATNQSRINFYNTGGAFTVGIDSSAGGQLLVGSAAYAGVINHPGTYPLQFGTNNAVRITIASTGQVTLGVIDAESTDVDKFLVSNAGEVKYRTGAQVLSDIGAAASSHTHSKLIAVDGSPDPVLSCDADGTSHFTGMAMIKGNTGGTGTGIGIYYNTGTNVGHIDCITDWEDTALPVELDIYASVFKITGTVNLQSCADAGADVDKFLVCDGTGNIDYRTGAETLSDIGAQASITWPAQYYVLRSAGTGTVPVASKLYDDGTNLIATDNSHLQFSNNYGIQGRNVAGSAYRSIIKLDNANNVVIGQDTDIASVTIGCTASELEITTSAITHNYTKSDIDFDFYGDTVFVAAINAGLDQFVFGDMNGGIGAYWQATAGPGKGYLQFQSNRYIKFGNNTDGQIYSDGTDLIIHGKTGSENCIKIGVNSSYPTIVYSGSVFHGDNFTSNYGNTNDSPDGKIYSDGTDFFIDNPTQTGDTWIKLSHGYPSGYIRLGAEVWVDNSSIYITHSPTDVPTSDTVFRITNDGTNLLFDRRESGAWVNHGSF